MDGNFTPVLERRKRIFSYAKFNLDALLSLATRLRGGRLCTTDVSKRPKAGCLNWVIFVTFDDGIEWVFRSPRREPSIKTESHCKMTISEACTLKYLRKHSSVPLPEVYSSSGSHDNEIGVPYILMSKASGRALSEYDWSEVLRIPGYPVRIPLLPLTDRDREKIMGQLGTIMSLLSDIHFDKIGSLFEAEDGSSDCSVGECLNPSLLWEKRDKLKGIDRGPFDQEGQYLSSLISAFVSHAKELRLSPHSFFAPLASPFEYCDWANYRAAVDRWEDFYRLGEGAEGSKNRLSYCLAGEFLREMIPSLTSHASQSRNFGGSTLPPGESLVAAFRAGFGQGGKMIEPELWVKDYMLFKKLFELAHEDKSDGIPRLFRERSMQEQGRELLTELQGDVEGEESEKDEFEEDESDEEKGGPKMETERMAVARKLMLMSEMNSNFVADKKLWRWLGDALDKSDSE